MPDTAFCDFALEVETHLAGTIQIAFPHTNCGRALSKAPFTLRNQSAMGSKDLKVQIDDIKVPLPALNFVAQLVFPEYYRSSIKNYSKVVQKPGLNADSLVGHIITMANHLIPMYFTYCSTRPANRLRGPLQGPPSHHRVFQSSFDPTHHPRRPYCPEPYPFLG